MMKRALGAVDSNTVRVKHACRALVLYIVLYI